MIIMIIMIFADFGLGFFIRGLEFIGSSREIGRILKVQHTIGGLDADYL